MIPKRTRQFLACLMTGLLLGLNLQPVHAAMVGNPELLEQAGAQAERDRLVELLARDEVRQQMSGLGVDPAAVEQRLARLTEAEVAQFNQRLSELPAGGDALGVALVVFIVFVITDVVGATDIFPFIKPVKQ